ncbi:ArsR family transcriptional regulator [Deinococcus cavernae]|uniref:ArsR family transcriptional regulator n=1 Tax=Deinococcus cavernae TaxID=2320857 RepID=A0A418VHW5_9DEIO|nr:helix-turn-helix transcriptional regulator [Deinococcus cavernae]RJF75667.1 ArsR family transcriptional regulator [Deinococcus cavernae]
MEQWTESSLPARVTSAEVAQVLRKVEHVQQLRHFMTPRGSTVSEFAAAQGWPHLKAYRQVKLFEKLGLLEVSHSEKRAGRAIHYYRCPSQRYFLPASLVSIEEYLNQSFQPHEGQIKHELAEAAQSGDNPVAGLLVGAFGDGVALLPADREGQPWSPDAPESPAMFFGIGPLFLDYPQAKALQAELQEVFERYGQQAGGARYLYQVIFTPDSTG